MTITKLYLVMVLLTFCMGSAAWGGENNISSSGAEKDRAPASNRKYIGAETVVSGMKEISGVFLASMHKKETPAMTMPPLAQPGSYSLTPPHAKPTDKSLREFLHEKCTNEGHN